MNTVRTPNNFTRIEGFVWCEVHCEVHEDKPDPYGMGQNCRTSRVNDMHWPVFTHKNAGAD